MFEDEGGYEEKVWRGDEYWYEKALKVGIITANEIRAESIKISNGKMYIKGTGDLGPN
jgi:hypothetical protein